MSAASASVDLVLPRLHSGQDRVVAEARRFNVLACGRRFGKTTLGIDRLVHPALAGYPVAYFAPTYKMLSAVWREAVEVFRPVTHRPNAQEHRLELVTGGVVDMWSLDNPDAARGRKYKRALPDECAMVADLERAWNAVIRPTLTDYQGDAWFLSTPRGLNFFHTLFQWGQDPTHADWASWQMPTVANPLICAAEVESARVDLPEATFRQEYLAEFLQNAGAVFRNVDACLLAPASTPDAHAGHRIVMGADWAQQHDFTALSVGCADCKQELALDRFNRIEWAFQRARLVALRDRWGVVDVLAEENSIGSPNIEALEREGVPVRGFQTTSASKPPLIQSLALALEREEWRWLPDATARGELVAYEARVNRHTGRISYSAPEGMHDDTVMARALVLWAALHPLPAPQKFGVFTL